MRGLRAWVHSTVLKGPIKGPRCERKKGKEARRVAGRKTPERV